MNPVADLLSRSREQLGYFWRSIAPIPIAKLLMALKADHIDAATCLDTAIVFAFLARYSIGNYNYAATVFAEGATWFGAKNPRCEIRKRFAYDAVLFALELLMLTWMGHTVQSPRWFVYGVIGLLLADLLFWVFDRYSWPQWAQWLWAIRNANPSRDQQQVVVNRDWPLRYPPRIWVLNNLCTAVALAAYMVAMQFLHLDDPGTQALGASLICLANSAVDLFLTRLHFDGTPVDSAG